jgi:hypothetical protein
LSHALNELKQKLIGSSKAAKKRRTTPEGLIKNEILKWFYRHQDKYFVWPNDSVGVWDQRGFFRKKKSQYHINGVADILGLRLSDGRLIAVEVKSQTGQLSDNQKLFLDRVKQSGGIAIVARSWIDIARALGDET